MRIEDYGLIGDMQAAALVGRDGTVDWLCLPRFDSASCFSALVGDERHGRWVLGPAGEVRSSSRRYRPGTLVLETDFETADGTVRVIDFMPRRGAGPPRLMRIVEGLKGRVPMRMELSLRPDYGSIVPWVEPAPDGVIATAGPDAFRLSTPLPLHVQDGTVSAEFVAVDGARERFTLTWHLSYAETPPVEDADSALARTEAWWQQWSGRCAYQGPYREAVLTSLIALKAMTDETTGAVIAAPTTSLPEDLGGVRNWDYRYCWLRDSVLALQALLAAGYTDEALGFRDFLLRVGTGDPTKIQIMYGIRGERRLTEFELDELPGYEGSKPVRVGNAASEQFQLDVYGEVMGVAFIGVEALGRIEERLWPRWRTVVEHVETIWREPDDGIWETRGQRQHFTYSKVMAWVVFDRAVRIAERFELEAEGRPRPSRRDDSAFVKSRSEWFRLGARQALGSGREEDSAPGPADDSYSHKACAGLASGGGPGQRACWRWTRTARIGASSRVSCPERGGWARTGTWPAGSGDLVWAFSSRALSALRLFSLACVVMLSASAGAITPRARQSRNAGSVLNIVFG